MAINHTFKIEYIDTRYLTLMEAVSAYRIVCEHRIAAGEGRYQRSLEYVDSLLRDLLPKSRTSTEPPQPLDEDEMRSLDQLEQSWHDDARVMTEHVQGRDRTVRRSKRP